VAQTPRGRLVQIPASATPLVRLPLFWLAFKNFPMPVYQAASRWCLASDGALNAYFHPWEFTDLSAQPLPRFVKRLSGEALASRMRAYLGWLGRRAHFATYAEYARRTAEGAHTG